MIKVFKNEKLKNEVYRTYDLLLEKWDIQLSQVDIEIRFGSTHVIHFGNCEAMPLILFHGVGDNSALMWIYNAKALSEHFNVFAIDTIGGPGKSVPNENYNKTFDDICWIDEVLDKLSLEKVFVAGVSNGGYLTQLYTLKCPERVIKSISMASSVPSGSSGSPMKTMMKVFLPEALFPNDKNIKKLLSKLTGKNSAVFTENPLIMEHYSYLLKGFNNMAMGYHQIKCFSKEEIDQIREKCLYLVGDCDPFEKLGGKKELQSNNMNTVFYPEVGHGINHEISDTINKKIIGYFTE